ncbi:MAG: GGDEF domain-containing protein [Betaproteobacteria bacterium]|nr:GGDEF domain-containing protein [Betaproteobacteria bacterium]
MAQNPNVIGVAVMQRLKETGASATPENYERLYYDISGEQRPETEAVPTPSDEPRRDAAFYADLVAALREMLQEVSDKTANLAQNLGEKNHSLATDVSTLRSSRDKQEILRLLSSVVMQASGIQSVVESSHKELQETRSALSSMQEELAETRQMLNEDALTGALNRRGMDQTLAREVVRAQRSGSRMSLAMADLDHFKRINDTYGHEAGDRMLMHFANLIRSVLRGSDALVRYGGEEFALILPDTDERGALLVLGRLQQLMKGAPMQFEGREINTTFSAGIACLGSDENGHSLLRRADEALYAAKHGGRDQIKIARQAVV